MTLRQTVDHVARVLDALGIEYMLVGSFSSNFYGVERATLDLDVVIQLNDTPISKLAKALGDGFKLDPQMSFETVTATQRYIASVRESEFKIEMFLLSDDAHDRQRFSRKIKIATSSGGIYMPTVEDVIVTKTRWARRKDVDDLTKLIAIQNDRIDWDYVYRWCDIHNSREQLDEIRRALSNAPRGNP